jgi:pimeloyl-ACP methyl ester carboxylesterase
MTPALIGDLKQVRRYLREPEIRTAARQRVLEALGPNTRVVIGHSLGSVVAYEALCAAPEQPATTMITIGSPLGIRHLIFDQLEPAPQEGLGHWPAGLARWVNIASPDDIVALEKKLATRFGPGVVDQLVENGAQAHDAKRYLCSREVGDAVAAGL